MKNQNTQVDKKYQVIIEKDINAKDGYDFFHPDEAWVNNGEYKRCTVTYYYKKIKGNHNPIMFIESISGDDFSGRFCLSGSGILF